MNIFPEKLNVKNKENFYVLNKERVKNVLRTSLYDHIISKKETEYFCLDEFNLKEVGDMRLTCEISKEIIKELENLGWNCKTSFGGTGLFIYSDKKPVNCFPDD